MKILKVIPSLAPAFGGPTNVALQLSFALARQGQDVTIFTTDSDVKGKLDVPLMTPIYMNDIRLFYFPAQHLKNYKFSLPLMKMLKRHIPDFDIVHIYSLFQFSTQAACYYCLKFNKPYIIEPLGQLDPLLLSRHFFYKKPYLRIFEYRNLRNAAALRCTSEMEKGWCDNLRLGLNNIVVPLGIDLEETKNLPPYGTFRSRYPELKDKKIVLFLGRIDFKKGLDILIKAFKKLTREREDIYLVIAGPDSGGYASKVKKWLRDKGLLNRTVFTGMLSGNDKLAAFGDSDIFVLPSYSENFALSVLEAMACKLPVVITNRVGLYPDVEEHKAGIVTECDPDQIAEAISNLLKDENLRKSTGGNGRRLVEDRFTINKIGCHVIKMYETIIRDSHYAGAK